MAEREGATRTLLSFPWIFCLSSQSRICQMVILPIMHSKFAVVSVCHYSGLGKRLLDYRRPVVPDKLDLLATVSDSLSLKRCFFPSRAPLVPLKVVCRGSVTKPCTPTFSEQGDTKVSQQFQFDWDCRQVTFKAYLPDRQEAGQVIL